MRLSAARPPAMTMALARARGAASAARPQARPAPRRRPGTAGSQAIASTGRSRRRSRAGDRAQPAVRPGSRTWPGARGRTATAMGRAAHRTRDSPGDRGGRGRCRRHHRHRQRARRRAGDLHHHRRGRRRPGRAPEGGVPDHSGARAGVRRGGRRVRVHPRPGHRHDAHRPGRGPGSVDRGRVPGDVGCDHPGDRDGRVPPDLEPASFWRSGSWSVPAEGAASRAARSGPVAPRPVRSCHAGPEPAGPCRLALAPSRPAGRTARPTGWCRPDCCPRHRLQDDIGLSDVARRRRRRHAFSLARSLPVLGPGRPAASPRIRSCRPVVRAGRWHAAGLGQRAAGKCQLAGELGFVFRARFDCLLELVPGELSLACPACGLPGGFLSLPRRCQQLARPAG